MDNKKPDKAKIHLTVGQLRIKLDDFPNDAVVTAYEGEVAGIGILDAEEKRQIGFVETDYG